MLEAIMISIAYCRCMLHNFAGNVEMYGILDSIASGPIEARSSPYSTMVSLLSTIILNLGVIIMFWQHYLIATTILIFILTPNFLKINIGCFFSHPQVLYFGFRVYVYIYL